MRGPARIALIGYGRIGTLHARTIRDHIPALDVCVVADPQQSARDAGEDAGYTTTPDWQQAVERPDIDGVLIASATEMHAEQVIAAAAAGKAIFCEKPIAPTLADTDRALDAVIGCGAPLQVGFQRRFDPPLTALRDAITEGDAGTPLLLRISARDPEPPPPWYLRFPGGLYIDCAIHDLDTARFLLGEVVEISSIGAALFDQSAANAGDVDTAVTTLRFASGAIGAIDNCRVSAAGFDQRIEVHGTGGTVMIQNMAAQGAVVARRSGITGPRNVDFFTQRYSQAYAAQFRSFADVVGGADPAVTGADARAAFLLALAAEQARTKNRPITLPAAIPTST
jgi:myo-inositol 2-dehydrogenase / D-chiro-inositol 1-dehydrogenase